ncbi:MAG: choice-of-anchor D domain-containing protein [Fidelibacterota bacterium]
MYLGEMAHGDTIKADWFVQNTGNDTLDVWDIYSNDYHFSVGLNTFSLEPGGLISIPVEFVPDGKGLYSTTMYFSHNAPNVTQNWIDLYGIGYDGYFKTVQPTGLPYTIIIDSIMVDHLELNYGEEIGVFADSLCVGVGVKGLLEKIQMVAWQKDEGFNLPGFSIDDSISYKFWGYRYDDNREVDLISTYDAGNGLFGYEPLSVVSLSGSTGLFSSIKTSDDKIVFGTSPINNDKSQEIVISNEGNATLNIHDIRFSSGVFFTNQSAFSISPDSSKLLQVFFQPIEAEYYTESMTIHYNDPVNSPLKINLEGLGLPLHQSQLKLPSPNLTFDPTIVGGSLTLDLYIINDGNSPLSINSIVSTSPDFNVDFSPVNINPGSLANFPITFIPSSKGMSTAKFQITSDNAGNGSNHYVYARGVGYDGFFQPVSPTGLPYHIIIDSLATFYDSHLDIGDEVGVFDNDFCVGVGVVKDNILNDKPGAIVVDGNHDFIDCGVPELMFNSTSGTMEAWVNPSLLNSDHWFFSYSMDDENAFAACIQSNGVLGYQMNSGGVHGTSNQTAQIDQWTHVAISWNNSEIKLFVNGILDNTINQSGHPTYSEDHLYIGIDSFDRNQYSFSGSIDEVRLWNIERSESQIQDNMNSIISTNSNNLIGYWRIENDEISIVEDLTGNGYNGTIFGDVQITQDIPPITSSLGGFAQLQITAWEKDETYGLPGFTLGDSMLFLVRSNFNNDSDTIPEIHLADPVYRSGDGYFGTGKLSVSQLYVTDKKYSKNIGLSKTSLDIGQVQIDSVSTEMITINNYGNFPLSVFNIKNSNPSFTLSDSSFVLSPNDSIMLKISFHATRIKTEHDTIAIKNNDLDEEDQLKFIYLSATGIDTIGPHSPADINAVPFSKVVILNWISSVDKDIYKYLVHRGIESVSDSVIAEVYYPDTTFTDYDAIHDVEYYYYLTPVDTLNNKGKSSSVVSAIPHLRHIVVSDDILNFGSIQVDSIDTLPFTIWSKGNQPLNILDMDISDEFAISDTSVSLSAVDSITLTITLKPNRPKIIIDTLYIYNDDVDLEDQVKKVVLTGLGIDTIPPILPMNVVSNTAPKQITITWSSNIEPDLEKYLIHRGIDAPDDAIIAEVFSPDTIFIDTDIYRDIIYYYYVTAMDTVGNISAPSDTIMALAVNSPPEMTSLIDLSQESHGNIQLQFLVEDVENDSINYGFYFSTDRLNWSIPTLTDILENNSSSIIDTLNFTWISEEDLGETDLHDVYLKIEAFDQFDTSIFVSDPMNIDNFVGTVIINPDQELDEYSNQIQFPYVIIDTTYDHYDLSLSFSIDSGFTWNGFEIWTIADSTMYFDTIKWNSQQDLLNFDGEVQVAFGLNDGWQYGVGDTLSLNLDNQFLPNIVNVELANYCFDPVRFTFNKEIDFASLLDGLLLSSRHGIYEGYQLDYDMSSYMVTIKNATGWLAGDSLDIELTPNVTDIYGNPFDGNGNDDPDSTGDSTHYTIPINLLGDFDNSGGVNFADLLSFQQFWLSDSLTITDEVGPTIGIPPYFQFLPDNKFDFEDLMVFIQMWNWTAGFDYGGGENLAKTVHSNHERLTLNTDYTHSESGQKQLKITLNVQDFINVGAMEFKIQYDTSDVKFIHLSSSIDNSWVILSHNDERNGRITINIADLEKNVRSITGSPLTISFIGLKEIESGLIWQADIRNRKGGTKEIVSGTYKFNTFAPVPEEYALHQNFPNPFNPTTNIQYDLPEETQVFLVIYNLLGQEVTQLVNKTQTAGFYSVIWNSKNRYGKLVSPGIYFYLLKTDNYSSVRKLVLLK